MNVNEKVKSFSPVQTEDLWVQKQNNEQQRTYE